MNKCSSCGFVIPIVRCRDCSAQFCYNCDERVHANYKYENHCRNTIPFRESKVSMQSSRVTNSSFISPERPQRITIPTQVDEDNELIEKIAAKQQSIQNLKLRQQDSMQSHKQMVVNMRSKYEQQITQIEQDLLKSAGQHQGDDEMTNIARECNQLEEKIKQTDMIVDKLAQTQELQVQQLGKMDEVLIIFKQCSHQLQQEKEMLLLDNEKLIAEVELFAKFMEENAELMTS